jgi:hypothetical protein
MKIKHLSKRIIISSFVVFSTFVGFSGVSFASKVCGSGLNKVVTSIDFNCTGRGNPIFDLVWGIIRFLSVGVSAIVVMSLIIAGLQYIGSQGSSENTNKAINRIRRAIIGLIIWSFAFAIINYLVPGKFLK